MVLDVPWDVVGPVGNKPALIDVPVLYIAVNTPTYSIPVLFNITTAHPVTVGLSDISIETGDVVGLWSDADQMVCREWV
jgi:hypothetical protein